MSLYPLTNPYGVTHSAQGSLNNEPTRFADMVAMKIGNLRLFCNWDTIEKKNPDGSIYFDWTIFDGMVSLAQQNNIKVTYALDSAPSWHTDSTLCPGKSFMIPADAAAFLAMVATRYLSYSCFIGIEIANEGYSDGASQCKIGPYAANLSKAVYPAIKAVNSSLHVGSPAILGLQQSYIFSWLTAFYSNGGLSDYDNFHFYTQQMPDATPNVNGNVNFKGFYQTMARVQAAYGYASKPIRCTETGIAANQGGITYQIQSDFYIRALELARRSGGKVEMVNLFTIQGSNGFSPVSGTSQETFHSLYYAHAGYVNLYPQWPGELDQINTQRRDNGITAMRRTNTAKAVRRDCQCHSARRDGKTSAKRRDNLVTAVRRP